MKKTLFIDCSMGAAGDMLCAALLELFDAPQAVLEELNGLGIPHTVYEIQNTEKCGIYGTKLCVKVAGQEETAGKHTPHTHFGLNDIVSVINGTNAPARVKEKALGVYRLLAEAESRVHRTQVEHIHFHELGTLDAVADILAFCYLLDKAGVEQIRASAVNVGKGTVRCAHGVLPVPAPATALLLKEVPIYSGSVEGELCTPTGAALLKTFVDTFGDMPQMRVQKIGYGMGTKDFETANCIRMFLGESEDTHETILHMHFNVDDMTAEEIAFGMEELMHAGARDVFFVPVTAKKSRPGTLVNVLCMPEQRETMLALIFKHFSTLGVRESVCQRYVLAREIVPVDTPFGVIHRKDAAGFGVKKSKYEYEDLARVAREKECSIGDVKKALGNEEIR
ncbi:MAG: nickel pincer cofactor biosynthesis protein LarC [Clostridia bacterium]|nr:nickel pincer cofactor biosynthesis protein LarC [Clostridia bacterium]